MAFEPKVTEKGTKLQIMDLKGKAYMPVAQRLVWFREVHPKGFINTEIVSHADKSAVVKATVCIYNEAQNSFTTLATGYKKETEEGFFDYIEKAETGAVGRALAMAGFGTQFETGFDEGDRLADAPIEVEGTKSGVQNTKNAQGKSPVRTAGGKDQQPTAGAGNSPGLEEKASVPVPAAALNPSSPPSVGGQAKSEGLVSKAKTRLDVNNLLSSVSRSLSAKRLTTVSDIKSYMKKTYGTDDKEKLSDEQATGLLSHLDRMNTQPQDSATH